MKKVFIFVMAILSLMTMVYAAPVVVTNETTSVEKQSFIVDVVVNESASMNFYWDTVAGLALPANGGYVGNDTELISTVSGLTCNSVYYWKVNGTNANGDYTTPVQTVTTDQCTISNAFTRFILTMLSWVLSLVILLGGLPMVLKSKQSTKTIIAECILIVIFSIVFPQIVTGFLAG